MKNLTSYTEGNELFFDNFQDVEEGKSSDDAESNSSLNGSAVEVPAEIIVDSKN